MHRYVDIILPLALSGTFTYRLPEWLAICAIGGVGCAVGYALIRRLHLRCATFALHAALVCILSGAVVTYYHGETGYGG